MLRKDQPGFVARALASAKARVTASQSSLTTEFHSLRRCAVCLALSMIITHWFGSDAVTLRIALTIS